MNKKLQKELKEKLEKEKKSLEKQLDSFAKKDEKIEGDWNTHFPHWNGDSGGSSLERGADEVEQYISLLPLEYNLEVKLKDVNLALEKLKKGKYGKCEKCGKKIKEERLKVYPGARFCMECQKK